MAGPLPMIEATFENRIMTTIETLQKSVHDTQAQIGSLTARIDQTDARSREAMVKVEQERAARATELERMQQRIEQIGTRTSERFDEMAKKLNEIGDLMSRLSGKMDGWDDLLQMREEATKVNTAKIDRLEVGHAVQESAISLLTSNHEAMVLRLRGIDSVLYGNKDQPDAPASVFGTLKIISETLTSGFAEQRLATAAAAQLECETIARVERLEAVHREQVEKWGRRRARLLAFFEKLTSNKYFWWAIAGGAGAAAAVPQEVKDLVAEFFGAILGG